MFDLLNHFLDSNKSDRKIFQSQFDGKSLSDRDPEFIKSVMPLWEWFYRNYFWVKSDGWEHIPARGKMLLVGSHNGGLAAPDMHMAMYEWFRRFGSDRVVYGLMHPQAIREFGTIAEGAIRCGAVVAEPRMAFAAFESGASVLVYP
ncbi:MAG: glycerol acyltransferase, partial [Okeania sp. SIO2H7]|nr:glycerol acyltransferase [Okeania sp. SIO2H7]